MARPFVVGDTITVASVTGVVKEVIGISYDAFQQKGIAIPFPQRDVHIVSDEGNGSKSLKGNDIEQKRKMR